MMPSQPSRQVKSTPADGSRGGRTTRRGNPCVRCRRRCCHQSINQPINQPTDQSFDQPINQSTNQPTKTAAAEAAAAAAMDIPLISYSRSLLLGRPRSPTYEGLTQTAAAYMIRDPNSGLDSFRYSSRGSAVVVHTDGHRIIHTYMHHHHHHPQEGGGGTEYILMILLPPGQRPPPAFA